MRDLYNRSEPLTTTCLDHDRQRSRTSLIYEVVVEMCLSVIAVLSVCVHVRRCTQ
jgi:hypothetical protein